MEIVSEEMNFILKFLRKALVNDFIEIKTKLVKSEKKIYSLHKQREV